MKIGDQVLVKWKKKIGTITKIEIGLGELHNRGSRVKYVYVVLDGETEAQKYLIGELKLIE